MIGVYFVASAAFHSSDDGASHHKKNQPLFEIEGDPDLFHVLKVRQKKKVYGRNIMRKRKRMGREGTPTGRSILVRHLRSRIIGPTKKI